MHALKDKPERVLLSSPVAGPARFLRRCRAFVMRLSFEGIRMPRYCGSYALLGFFGATALFGMVAGGYSREVFSEVSSAAGFSVNRVEVSGNNRTSEIDILAALKLDGDTAMIGFNVDHARAAVAALPWVASVTVQKIYPDQVKVAVVERQPFAVWQHDGMIDIIDRDGRIIVPWRAGISHGLPLLVGRGAEKQAAAFFEQIATLPEIRERVQAYVRVSDRRWDLLLDNGVRVKLPAADPGERLAAALALEDKDGLFSRDVQGVDLRLDDRVTVALSDEAMARRAAAVKESDRRRQARKAGRT